MEDVLLSGVLPIFAVPVFGYLAGRYGLFDQGMAEALNRFAFYFSIPALSINLLANAPFEDFDTNLVIGYFIAEILVCILGFCIARFGFKCEIREAILLGLVSGFSNHVLFVLPIAIALFGDAAALPITAIITVDATIMFSGTLLLLDTMGVYKPTFTSFAKSIVKNPPVVAILFGVLIAYLGIDLPKGVQVFLDFSGATAAPCAMFALGIVMSQQKLSARPWIPITFSAIKLVVHPLVAWVFIGALFQVSPELATPGMMAAAGPCGAMAFVLALKYDVRMNAISTAILYTTIGSILTVSIAAIL